MAPTPASLLQRLRKPGDTAAWDRFVQLYSPLLFHWALRTGLQDADAADLVQDVFAILVRQMPSFEYDPSKSFRSWLRVIASNKCRERLRKHSAGPHVSLDHDMNELPASAESPFWEREFQVMLTQRLLQVMQAEFQPTTWKACWATVVEGRSAADVGRELQMSPEAVRMAKCRVLCRLQRELDGMLD